MTSLDELKSALRDKPEPPPLFKGMLSTGSTLLNLACSGRPSGGFARGGYYLIVGDSTSGKTVLSGTCFAEAAINPKFDNYLLVHDNAEGGALMFEKFFGSKIAARIRPPETDKKGNPVYSHTVEDFYYHLYDCLRGKQPVIYVLDSENSLSSEAEQKKFEKRKVAHEEDTEAAGSYTDAKAKAHSQNLRGAIALLRDTGSILIIISQTRDNLGFGFEKKTRSGGRALKFYAMLEMWSSVKKKLVRTVKGKPRTIGIVAEVQIKKNRFIGKDRTVSVPIYHSVGFDDIGGCIDYLVEEKHWTVKDGLIDAKDFAVVAYRDPLVRHIETNELEHDLRVLVWEVWQDIEDACEVRRKSRYQ